MRQALGLAAIVGGLAAFCGDPSGVEVRAQITASPFDHPACGVEGTPPSVRLVTDVSASNGRLVILRCAIEGITHVLGDASVPTDVVAGMTVDSLGALMVQLDLTLTIEDVAREVTRIESAVFTAPIAVAVEPFWLLEAAPTGFADRTMSSTAFDADRRAVATREADRANGFPGLRGWEAAEGFGPWDPPATRSPSALRFAALVEVGRLLVDRAGADALLREYRVARASSDEPWTVTFARVFGVAVDDFYAEIDAHFAEVAATGSFD